MYPYPVSGRVGFMPNVSMASVSLVNLRHELTTRLNSCTSVTTWSLGVTMTLAPGHSFLIRQLTYAIQGAVLRLHGSSKMWLGSISGNCSATKLWYFLLVTIHTFDGGHTVANLSSVSCNNERPVPSTSINCFGFSSVLIGQNLLPTPPAMMTR